MTKLNSLWIDLLYFVPVLSPELPGIDNKDAGEVRSTDASSVRREQGNTVR
jgi:hypothetical protein